MWQFERKLWELGVVHLFSIDHLVQTDKHRSEQLPVRDFFPPPFYSPLLPPEEYQAGVADFQRGQEQVRVPPVLPPHRKFPQPHLQLYFSHRLLLHCGNIQFQQVAGWKQILLLQHLWFFSNSPKIFLVRVSPISTFTIFVDKLEFCPVHF